MKRTYVFLFWIIGGALLCPIEDLNAASLYIDPAISQINRGDSITMSVRLDTDEVSGECVNAVDVVIAYPNNIEPVDVSIGDSILRIWVEEPTINREERTVTFAGGIPNGYCGRVIGDPRLSNVLAKIIFQSPGFVVGGSELGTKAGISFGEQSTVYLNDGFGTKASLSTYSAEIDLASGLGSTIQNQWQNDVNADEIPPEEFGIMLQKDDKAFSQKYYIIFNTTDKQTGVDHFEVMEEPLTQFGSFQWGRADAPWIETRSPYVLNDQSLNSIIRVKAVDKAGNEYVATLIPDNELRTVSQAQLFTIIGGFAIGLLIVVLLALIIWHRRRKVSVSQQISEDKTETYE